MVENYCRVARKDEYRGGACTQIFRGVYKISRYIQSWRQDAKSGKRLII